MRQQIKSLSDQNTIPVSRLILLTGVPDSNNVEEIALAGLTLRKSKKKHGRIGLKQLTKSYVGVNFQKNPTDGNAITKL